VTPVNPIVPIALLPFKLFMDESFIEIWVADQIATVFLIHHPLPLLAASSPASVPGSGAYSACPQARRAP